MEGYEVTTLEEVVEFADIFITATGNRDVITVEHMARMKDKAIVGNIGHFDNEIDMAGLARGAGLEGRDIKPQYDERRSTEGPGARIPAAARSMSQACAPGHPRLVM